MLVICLVSFSAGLAFFLAGAWPVVGFIGADVLLIYLAFQVNYRRAGMYEDLQLTADSLTVRKVSHHGKVEIWTFQPYWLQVQIDRPAEQSSRLILRSHGKSISIGAFLTAGERAEVARELTSALSDLRHGATGHLTATHRTKRPRKNEENAPPQDLRRGASKRTQLGADLVGRNEVVRRRLAVPAGHKIVLDLLAFTERAHASALHGRDVNKGVLGSVFRLDKSIALYGVIPLYSSCRHRFVLRTFSVNWKPRNAASRGP